MKLLITKLAWNGKAFAAAALYQGKRLVEIRLEEEGRQGILGNIYIGRVKDIVKSLNAAFIEIAPGKPCYYPLDEMRSPLFVKKSSSPRLAQGDELVVQVEKESQKTKPPKVTTNINLTGKYLVLTSENRTVGISKKLDGKVREELKEKLDFGDGREFGVVVRTNAASAGTDEILREYGRLAAEYGRIRERAAHGMPFTCLKERPPGYLGIFPDIRESDLEEILTDDAALHGAIEAYLREAMPEYLPRLAFYEDELVGLKELFSLRERLREALRERVWLKSGGYLIIQPTEALTAIDVNSGKTVSKKSAEEYRLRINLEAAEEIARQLRLRNISGIVIVDFIDMESEEAKERLLKAFRLAVREDRVPVCVEGMTRLGLVELTRKKTLRPLAEQLGSLGLGGMEGD